MEDSRFSRSAIVITVSGITRLPDGTLQQGAKFRVEKGAVGGRVEPRIMYQQDGVNNLRGSKVGLGCAAIPVENAAHIPRELGDTLGPLFLAIG